MGYLVILFLILVFLVEQTVNKLFGVEKKKISETSGKNFERWSRAIILVLFLSLLPIVIRKDIIVMKWFYIAFFVVSLGFQSILEWKFLKNSKQYFTTLIYLILTIIFFYNIDYFIQ